MQRIYTLMHKNHPCASVIFNDAGKVEEYRTTDPVYTPYLGNCDRKKFARWWEMRAVPPSRNLMKQVMQEAGSTTPEEYLERNLALSITDSYWICPEDANLTYEDVKLSGLSRYVALQVPYYNAAFYDLNASLGGKMDKYWDLSGNVPILVKESYRYYGQQAINEVFATKIHELQETSGPFVRYTATRAKGGGCAANVRCLHRNRWN